MPISNPFKLQKLTIKVYDDAKRLNETQPPFEVMFNPESIKMRHENRYRPLRGQTPDDPNAEFIHVISDKLNMKLLFDGTGVNGIGIKSFTQPSAAEQVKSFLNLCFHPEGDIHQPRFLKIQWGEGILREFNCRILSVDIDYTAFDRTGAALRATLDTTFISDTDKAKAARKTNAKSPDVTHSRVVKYGDTLPLLCKEIYGSSRYYLRVAQVNHLDNFRSLTPGQTLIFPPLEK